MKRLVVTSFIVVATKDTVDFNAPHAPHANAIEAFTAVLPQIKTAIIKCRHDWDKVCWIFPMATRVMSSLACLA